jgi:hypothetical protein
MKEALDLWGVQIHCDDVANTNDLQQIGDHRAMIGSRLPCRLSARP